MSDTVWRHPLPKPVGVIDRRTLMLEAAAGRRVVHLGCVDERQLETRIGTGDLLHEELAKVASELTGVDLSLDLGKLEKAVPGRYVSGDVERLDELDLPACDLVLMPELIEHVGNPAAALEALRRYLTRTGATALVTTPNAYSWTHVVRFAVLRSEWVHPDHRLVYTPVTLAAALAAADLQVDRWWAHAWKATGLKGAADRVIGAWNPWLSPGMVVEVH